MNQTANFRAMTARAKSLGLPKAFHADLTEHDAKFVKDGEAYIWVLYDSGTHTYQIQPLAELGARKARSTLAAVRNMTDPGNWGPLRIFHVADGVAREIDAETAVFLAEQA